VSAQNFGVTQTYPNTLCQGPPTLVEGSDDAPCIPTTCTIDGATSNIRNCGPAVGLAILSPSADATLSGWIKFEQTNTTAVLVTLNVAGIITNPNGLHGVHIHEFGDLRGFIEGAGTAVAKAAGVGSHWNPTGANHSCPGNTSHIGDLGNWLAVAGNIQSTKTIFGMSLVGVNSLIGHSVVVHATEDDCANVPSAGARLATGVIGIANVPANIATPAPNPAQTTAVCVFSGTSVKPSLVLGTAGLAYFTQEALSVRAKLRIYTNDTIERGFHIHAYGDLSSSDGTSAGPHWNPQGVLHSLPTVNDTRHLGDYGSVRAYSTDGNGWYDYAPSYNPSAEMTLWNFIGRGIIIHAGLDHGADPSCAGSNATGAAGARDLYCVIGIPNTADPSIPENFLEIPAVPTNIVLNNTWSEVPCAPTPAPVPVPVSPPTDNIIPILEAGIYPENIEWNPNTAQFLVGSLTTPGLYQVSMDGVVDIKKIRTGLISTGLHLRGNQLFTCWCTFPPGPASSVTAYSIATTPYTEQWTVNLENVGVAGTARFCNDLTSDKSGNVYVTDSAYNVIYRLKLDENGLNPALTLWSDNPAYKSTGMNLDGIVYHPNGYIVVGKLTDNAFMKVPISDAQTAGTPALIEVTGDSSISGPDGMVLIQNDRIIVSHSMGTGGAVSALISSDDFATATVSKPVATTYSAVASRIVDGTLYVLETNISAIADGNLASSQYDIVVIKDNSDLLGSSPNQGWIAAVVIIVLVVIILLAAFVFWHFSKKSGERA